MLKTSLKETLKAHCKMELYYLKFRFANQEMEDFQPVWELGILFEQHRLSDLTFILRGCTG